MISPTPTIKLTNITTAHQHIYHKDYTKDNYYSYTYTKLVTLKRVKA